MASGRWLPSTLLRRVTIVEGTGFVVLILLLAVDDVATVVAGHR
jgi:hypothetical protein